MSDDRFATRFDGGDPFAPDIIDEQIDARLAGKAPTERETRLTRGLATLNRLPPGADDSLARVRSRLRAAPFPTQTTTPTIGVQRSMHDFQTQPSHWPPSPPTRTPPRGPSPFRRTMQTLVAVAAVIALIGGFYALTHQRINGPGGQPTATTAITATNTAQATATATSTPLAQAATVAQVTACGFQASQPAYDLGNGLIAVPSTGQAYPAFQLPDGTPLKPFQVSTNASSTFPQSPLVNPNLSDNGGLALVLCNIGQQPVNIKAVRARIESVTPYSGQLNSWNPCDGSYSGPNTTGSGGCGGGGAYDLTVHASFAAGDGAGAAVTAEPKSGTLPFTLPVRKTDAGVSGLVLMKVGVTPPTAPGAYTFDLGLVTQQSDTAFLPASSKPMLFAPVAHKWDGQACLAPNMASQIPAETNPPTYYICPQS